MKEKVTRKDQETTFYDTLFTQENLFRGYLFEEKSDVLKYLFM